MYKVRIKSSPSNKSTGDQDQYGLVRNLAAMQSSPEQVSVNDTMGAVPRSEANIEVEGGESVIGDINKDGLMELMHFTGKRHSEGGVPVNIPEGSFIYSDTKKLTIKDPEVIEKIFNLPFRKQGYTPAEISKKYDINTFVQILKDENADAVSKRSAAEMLKKNKQKLGILAFIQESMKGFPDGIPAIAEEVLSTMGIDPNALMQEAAPQQPQGIPASEDEAAMQGELPAPPIASPDEMAMQMGAGKFGGTALPRFEMAGVTGCPPGKRMYMGKCVEEWRIPAEDEFAWTPAPSAPAPKKTQTEKQKRRQELFDRSFAVTRRSPQEIAAEKTAAALEQKRRESGYYEKADRIGELTRSTMGIGQEAVTGEELAKQKAELEKLYGEIDATKAADYKLENDMYQQQGIITPARQKEIDAQKLQESLTNMDFFNTGTKTETSQKKGLTTIPGFGTKANLDAYMLDTPEQYVAGETFYNALLSNDPQEMLRAAQELKKIDVPWSVGWLPFTDQDKIDDMYTILHEEALKHINKKQKDIILTQYTKPIVTKKVDDLIAYYQKKLDNAVDVASKIQLAKTLQKYKEYKNLINGKSLDGQRESDMFLNWTSSVKKSYVKPNSSFFDYDLGRPIQDSDHFDHNDQTIMGMLEEITSKHDAIKGTNYAKKYPLAFTGQNPSGGSGRGDTVSLSDESESFEVMNTENKIQDVADKLYANQTSSVKSSKNYKREYTLPSKPGVVYFVDSDADGKATWFERDDMGGVYAVSDRAVVQNLNSKASQAENKAFAIKPAAPLNGVTADDIIIEQKTQQRTKPTQTTVQKKTAPAAPAPEKPKFENGLTDENFNFAVGGSVNNGIMIRDGQPYRHLGNIDEFGRARYAKGGLVQYAEAGTVSGSNPPEEVFVKDSTLNGKAVKLYTQTFSDGTVINIIRDAGTNTIIGRKNMLTGEAINDPNQIITRGSTEYITKDNLNEWEKQQLATKWNNDENQYLTFLNSKNQMLTNKEFKDDLWKQYQADIENIEAYTGTSTTRKNEFKNTYYKDLKGLTQDQMLAELLAQEERNARLSAFGLDPSKVDQNVYKDNTNKTAYELRAAQQAGLGDLDWSKGHRGQAAYIAYRRLLENDPKYKEKNYAEFQQGQGDETIFGIKGKVSGIDNLNTDTTLYQRLGWKAAPPAKPGEATAWYCVEFSDGTKQVESVNYKEGDTPVPPSGGKITKATPYKDSTEAQANCKVDKPEIPEVPGVEPKPLQPQPWFAPDIVNFGTGLRQRVPYTPPTLFQMQPPASGYDTFNPITHIAGVTGAGKQYNDLLMNTMDPTVAAATAANFGFDALAKGISDVEAANLGVTNANYDKIAQRAMQVDQFNTGQRSQFAVNNAIATEERARDLNAKDAQNAMLWGRGWTNDMMDNGLRVEYPNAHHVNRITGDYAWSGTGRDPLAFDTYTSATSRGVSAEAATQDCLAVYSQAYSSAKAAGQDDTAAKEYAGKMQTACIQQNTAATTAKTRTPQGGYNQGMGSVFGASYTNPMMRTREFGGSFFDDDNY